MVDIMLIQERQRTATAFDRNRRRSRRKGMKAMREGQRHDSNNVSPVLIFSELKTSVNQKESSHFCS